MRMQRPRLVHEIWNDGAGGLPSLYPGTEKGLNHRRRQKRSLEKGEVTDLSPRAGSLLNGHRPGYFPGLQGPPPLPYWLAYKSLLGPHNPPSPYPTTTSPPSPSLRSHGFMSSHHFSSVPCANKKPSSHGAHFRFPYSPIPTQSSFLLNFQRLLLG